MQVIQNQQNSLNHCCSQAGNKLIVNSQIQVTERPSRVSKGYVVLKMSLSALSLSPVSSTISNLTLHLTLFYADEDSNNDSYGVLDRHHKKNGSIRPPNPNLLQSYE